MGRLRRQRRCFDAAFFGISPREAACMDPQHRWLLETAGRRWRTRALPPETLAGSRTGVFVGISHSDYPLLQRRDPLHRSLHQYRQRAVHRRQPALLPARSPAARASRSTPRAPRRWWRCTLRRAASGPSECDHALVGGANALLTPEASIGFSQAHMLSPRGRCRAFDAGADGYVRAEGAAAIVLMPLRATRRRWGCRCARAADRDASNQDGHSSGLTVPSQDAQEAMIREALRSAGLRRASGLRGGARHRHAGRRSDRSARAGGRAVGRRAADGPCLIGSVKTNIGHLEPASGTGGADQGRAGAGARRDTRPIFTSRRRTRCCRSTACAFRRLSRRCRASMVTLRSLAVNSFGFGGANAHALLARAPPPSVQTHADAADEPCIFPLSARSPASVGGLRRAFTPSSSSSSDASPSSAQSSARPPRSEIASSLRRALVADSLAGCRPVASVAQRRRSLHAATAEDCLRLQRPGPAVVGDGTSALSSGTIVRDCWEQCDATCRRLGGPSLLDALLADEADSRLDHTDIAQPALFALQAGLVELWRAWGIEPDAVIGHSVGEAAAAWAAGIFDLEEIFRVILARSRWQATDARPRPDAGCGHLRRGGQRLGADDSPAASASRRSTRPAGHTRR